MRGGVQGRVMTGYLVPENAYVAIICLRVADDGTFGMFSSPPAIDQ